MTASTLAALVITHDVAAQRQARRAAQVLFLILGSMAGTFGAHVPSLKAHYGLSEASLSWLLLVTAIGAVSCLLYAGRCVGRLGQRRTATLVAARGQA